MSQSLAALITQRAAHVFLVPSTRETIPSCYVAKSPRPPQPQRIFHSHSDVPLLPRQPWRSPGPWGTPWSTAGRSTRAALRRARAAARLLAPLPSADLKDNPIQENAAVPGTAPGAFLTPRAHPSSRRATPSEPPKPPAPPGATPQPRGRAGRDAAPPTPRPPSLHSRPRATRAPPHLCGAGRAPALRPR